MSLLRQVLRPERREASISEALLRLRGGPTYAGVPVTVRTALTLDAAYACVRLLVDLVSTLPFSAYTDRDGLRVKLPTQPSIVAAPSAWLGRPELMGQLMHSLATHGNAYGQIVARDFRGFPTQLEVRSPADVSVVRKGRTGPPEYRIDQRLVDYNDVLHIRGMMAPGEVIGISPVEMARETIGLGLAAGRYGASYFGAGGHPTAILKTDQKPNPEQAADAKARFKDAVEGDGLAVLGAGLDYMAIQTDPEKTQFIALQDSIARQTARFFGLPPESIGANQAGTSVTYANRDQKAEDLLAFSLLPWLIRIEDPWSAMLPRGQYGRFNPDGFLRADLKARYEAYGIGLDKGFLNPDEARAREEMAPIPDGKGQEFNWPPKATATPTGGTGNGSNG